MANMCSPSQPICAPLTANMCSPNNDLSNFNAADNGYIMPALSGSVPPLWQCSPSPAVFPLSGSVHVCITGRIVELMQRHKH